MYVRITSVFWVAILFSVFDRTVPSKSLFPFSQKSYLTKKRISRFVLYVFDMSRGKDFKEKEVLRSFEGTVLSKISDKVMITTELKL